MCIQLLHTSFYTYRLVPSTGKTRELSANNCKEIREALSTDCTKSPQSGVYWVQNQQVHMYVAMCMIGQIKCLSCYKCEKIKLYSDA